MITLLLIIPLIGSLLMLPFDENNPSNRSRIKQIALSTSIINLFVSVLLWILFDSNCSQYQFVEEFNQLTFCHFYVGIDGISLYFVLMTTIITPICILSSWEDIKTNLKYYLILFLVLETLQIAVFVVLDLLLFYIYFESVLIPLFLIIGIWGASESRIRASFLLFLYTLFGSLWMLLAIMVIFNNIGSTDFQLISLSEINLESQKLLWLAFFVSFAVKTPLWPVHGWLFRAHAEAPLAGSIILAAVILKLATYGYLRIILPMLPDSTSYFMPLIQSIAIITLIYSSLATLRQIDLKALIAYSSIGHMAVVVLGLFSNTIQGIEGAILLSIAHAFVSPALFICVGGILYNRYHTRILFYYRGLALRMPVFTILFFIFIIFNTAVPLSLNWVGEFLSLAGTFQRSPIIGALGASGIVLSACYSIWMYNRISYGKFSNFIKPTKDITRIEFMLLLPLLVLTLLFGLFPNIILDTLHFSVTTLLYNPINNILLFPVLSSNIFLISKCKIISFIEYIKYSLIRNYIVLKNKILSLLPYITLNQKDLEEVEKMSTQLSLEIEDIKTNILIGSDILEYFENLDTLGKLAITILISNYIITTSLISIVYIFYGDYLINKFNLEIKYPKLTKFIQLRKKFQRYYLLLNIFWIIFVVLIQVAFSLYILTH